MTTMSYLVPCHQSQFIISCNNLYFYKILHRYLTYYFTRFLLVWK